jgi:hypothetical protein
MAKRNRYSNDLRVGNFNLASARDRKRIQSMTVELKLQADALTQKDMRSWRQAWQTAIDVENPRRGRLYDIYRDVEVDLHLGGCVDQRKGFVEKKSFKLVDREGKQNDTATQILEAAWFKDLVGYILDSRYWGHSLIQLGDIITVEGEMRYTGVEVVNRKHVIQEYGVIIREQGDEWKTGIPYREGPMADWVIEAGKPRDLGLYLKAATQTIPKKNMLAYWDQFGEIFGMPIRIAKTSSRDPKDRAQIENMLSNMGAAPWGMFPTDTDIEIKETTRGDAFNIYDKRIDRANSELSKGILNQTMTIDNGSSLSQSEVHLEVFENVVEKDADLVRDIVNDQLLPRMVKHGFPVKGLHFEWDNSIDYTPEQQFEYEKMIADRYEVDPKYFIDKYGVPIIGEKKQPEQAALARPFFD